MLFRGDFSEKRDFFRMEVGCPMQYRQEGSGEALQQGTVRDLSASGLSFICQQRLSEGDRLEVVISPEKAIVPPLHASAEVVRVSEQETGGVEVGVKILEIFG
ncbi:MAG: PilZ domain-containing protein [Thiohalomonadaceae bacterium]